MKDKDVPYHLTAKYYDLLYTWKDYKSESQKIVEIIKKEKKSLKNLTLLEVACGTGKHLTHLRNHFKCEGTDLSKEMIDIARKNVKDVTFFVSDMVTLDVDRKYDIITCLFSSIGYVRTYSNLKKTIRNFSRLLNRNGIVLIEPWHTRKKFVPDKPGLLTYESDDIKIARTQISKLKGNLSLMNMHYLVAEKGRKDVLYFVDKHEMGLFENDKIIQYMEEAGFTVKFIEEGLMGRGLFIGTKI